MTDFSTNRRGLFGAGAMLAGAGIVGAAPAGASTWNATNEPADDWMERPGARHKLILDTTEASAAGPAAGYALNYIQANETGYGLKPQDLGVIIVLRHGSTPYAYGDATWKKYGRMFAKVLKLQGEEAIQAASGNPMLAAPTGTAPKGMEWSFGPPLTLLAQRGAQFAVCSLATEGIAMQLAKGGDHKPIEAALRADLIKGAHMVPAGIVAVERAQGRGYAFAYVA